MHVRHHTARPESQVSECISGVWSRIWGCPWGVVCRLHSEYCLKEFEAPLLQGAVGLARNWTVVPDSASSMVLATSVPS